MRWLVNDDTHAEGYERVELACGRTEGAALAQAHEQDHAVCEVGFQGCCEREPVDEGVVAAQEGPIPQEFVAPADGILSSFLQAALEHGAEACDALMTDTKVYVETILPTPLCIPTRLNGEVVIYMGARFSTSDYGDGAVDMRAFMMNGVCLNGMVRESTMKHIHLGARLPHDMLLSDETYRLNTQTTVSAVRDVTQQLFARENIEMKAQEIYAASEKEVDFDTELKRLVKNNWLRKEEGEHVQKLLMNNDPQNGLQGGATLWKLTQAITAYGRDLNSDRTRELHEVAGQVLSRLNKD